LMRFGLKDVNELPSMEEFEKLVAESFQSELIPTETATAEDASQSEVRPEQESIEEGDESSPEGRAQTEQSPSDPEHIERSAAPPER
jgi:segregation and condensation protein B